MNTWISVENRLPEFERPTLIWGNRLQEGDFPLLAWLCRDGTWLLLQFTEENDAAAQTERMCGTVTHWLDWSAPHTDEDHERKQESYLRGYDDGIQVAIDHVNDRLCALDRDNVSRSTLHEIGTLYTIRDYLKALKDKD
jgi:hypothetical protein